MSWEPGMSATAAAVIAVGRAVQIGAAGTVIQSTTATVVGAEEIVGICELGAASGAEAGITMAGPAKAIAGGAITRGTHLRLTTDAVGRLVAAANGDQVVALYIGTELDAVLGQEIDVWVTAGMSVGASSIAASLVTVVDAAGNLAATEVEAALAEIFTLFASVANAQGASLVGLEDAAANLAATDVEAGIAEIFTLFASVANAQGASLVGIEDATGLFTAADSEAAFAEVGIERPSLLIADPGNAVKVISVATSGVCALTSAGGGETRTLAIPAFLGQRIAFCHDVDGGDIAITAASAINQAGNTIMTFTEATDTIELVAMQLAGVLVWRVGLNDVVALS